MDNSITAREDGPMRGYCLYCMSEVRPGSPCPGCGLTSGTYVPNRYVLQPGTVLRDRYILGRVLGHWGSGITYIGRDLKLGLKVVVKEYLPPRFAHWEPGANEVTVRDSCRREYDDGLARFLREARSSSELKKLPGFANVTDFFSENGTGYTVTEFITGPTLTELMKQRGGALPAQEVLRMFEPLFASVGTMHGMDLVHRNISPYNMMLERGFLKLLDFGLSNICPDTDAEDLVPLNGGFAPIEQYSDRPGSQIGPWTDIYALAGAIYLCVTGRKPPMPMERIVDDGLIAPRNLGADITASQEAALLKALALRPGDRYGSASEFHDALYGEAKPDEAPVSGHDSGSVGVKRRVLSAFRHPAVLIITAAVLIAALILGSALIPGARGLTSSGTVNAALIGSDPGPPGHSGRVEVDFSHFNGFTPEKP